MEPVEAMVLPQGKHYIKLNTNIFILYLSALGCKGGEKMTNAHCDLSEITGLQSWSLTKQNLIMSDQSLTMVFFSDVRSRSFVLLP